MMVWGEFKLRVDLFLETMRYHEKDARCDKLEIMFKLMDGWMDVCYVQIMFKCYVVFKLINILINSAVCC